MEPQGYVYILLLRHPNGRWGSYIGQTRRDPEVRIDEHRTEKAPHYCWNKLIVASTHLAIPVSHRVAFEKYLKRWMPFATRLQLPQMNRVRAAEEWAKWWRAYCMGRSHP